MLLRRHQKMCRSRSFEDPWPMSVQTSGAFLQWFTRPLILVAAGLLVLSAATGLLSLQYWYARRSVDLALEHRSIGCARLSETWTRKGAAICSRSIRSISRPMVSLTIAYDRKPRLS